MKNQDIDIKKNSLLNYFPTHIVFTSKLHTTLHASRWHATSVYR